MATIYILEDDLNIQEIEAYALKNSGYQTEGFDNAREFFKKVSERVPSLLLLDIMLPDADGLDVLRKLRSIPETKKLPIILVTAKTSEIDKVKGLDVGADDYIIKPFRPRDLELRILSILKRAYPEKEDTLVLPACQVHFSQALITKGKLEIQLTAKEYSILKVLYDNKNRIVTFDQLLEKVWGLQYQGYDNTLMAHIRKIRQKIEANPSKPESLITVKGLGYKLKVN